ncbi:MAG: hypothetical protein R3F20_08850 [Planctomycetota bacterium]
MIDPLAARPRIRLTAAALLLLMCGPVRAQEGGALEIRSFDVAALTVGEEDADALDWALPLARSYRGGDVEDVSGRERGPTTAPLAPEELVDIVRGSFPPEVFAPSDRFIRILDGGRRLAIRLPAGPLDEVDRLLRRLGEGLAEDWDVEALVIEGDRSVADLLSGRKKVATDVFDALRDASEDRAPARGFLRGRARSGRRIALSSGAHRRFVGACDVEVAPSARVVDPRPLRVFEGLRIDVRPIGLGEGRCIVQVSGESSRDFVTTEQDTGLPSIGRLQLPQISVERFAAEGVVSADRCLVVGIESAGRPRLLVVRARLASRVVPNPAAGTRRRTLAIPIDALVRPPLSPSRLDLGVANGDPGPRATWGPSDGPNAAAPNPLDGDVAAEFLRSALGGAADRPTVFSSGTHLWVQGDEGALAVARELTDALVEQGARHLRVELQEVRVPRRGFGAMEKSEGENLGARLWRDILLERGAWIALEAAVGGVAELASGREFAFVSDYSSDVAEDAGVSVPVVQTGFTGLHVRVSPYGLVEGAGKSTVALHFEVARSELAPESGSFAGGGQYGAIQTPIVHERRSTGVLRLRLGEPEVIAVATDPASPDHQLVLVARIR